MYTPAGVRYSIHPKKRKLDADGKSETCSETDGRSRSQSPERCDQRRRSRPLSRSADSAGFASLRPELRQKRMQYHAVRRRKLRSGLDMIRRRKRTPSAKGSKPAVGADCKVGFELGTLELCWPSRCACFIRVPRNFISFSFVCSELLRVAYIGGVKAHTTTLAFDYSLLHSRTELCGWACRYVWL